jgi:hypothetical protein
VSACESLWRFASAALPTSTSGRTRTYPSVVSSGRTDSFRTDLAILGATAGAMRRSSFSFSSSSASDWNAERNASEVTSELISFSVLTKLVAWITALKSCSSCRESLQRKVRDRRMASGSQARKMSSGAWSSSANRLAICSTSCTGQSVPFTK